MRSLSKIFNLNDPGWGRGNNGNNNGSEPPRRPDNRGDGPPDLDEVWRDFNNKLGGMFGRKPRRGGNNPFGGGPGNGQGSGPSLPKGSPKMVGFVAVAAVGLWLASGFLIVQEGQVAVVTKFGKYSSTLSPGLQWHLPYPIEDHQIVNISQLRTFEVGFRGTGRNKVLPESLMLTTDENIIDIQYVVQYRLMPTGAPDYLFKNTDPDESVRLAAETAMREVVGRKSMDFVLYEGRTEVATDVQRLTQEILDRYQTGIQVSTVAIQNVQPPEQVQAAFDDAVKAGQDRERQINEGNAYANKIRPETEGMVARMMENAEGYRAKVIGDAQGDAARFTSVETEFAKAPQVTRERLYLSTMQQILQNSSKVLVDTQSSGNMLYLPLDRIMGQVAGDRSGAVNYSAAAETRAAAGAAAGSGVMSQSGGSPAVPSRTPARAAEAPYSSQSLVSPYSR
ncbi:MAG: FtsH protease activity modulator HflK [Alcaligenaceae bacterium]|nr:FtsH protease activity modulator HflK [Alcaligenaceae bacterium]